MLSSKLAGQIATIFVTMAHLLITTMSLRVLPSTFTLPPEAVFAEAYTYYLHAANVLDIFGFLGTLQHHVPTLKVYRNWLIADVFISGILHVFMLLSMVYTRGPLCANFPVRSSPEKTGTMTPDCRRSLVIANCVMAISLIILVPVQVLGPVIVNRFTNKILDQESSPGGLDKETDEIDDVLERKPMLFSTNYDVREENADVEKGCQ